MSKQRCANCFGGVCIEDGSPCEYELEESFCVYYEDPDKLIVRYIDVALIDHHPDNPRHNVGDVGELAASIQAEGIQQPLTLVPSVEGKPDRFTAVIGHRRLEAAKKAGLREVPAFIREMTRREQLRTMLTENGQREDLTPLEEADGFQQLMLELPEGNAEAVARETGFSATTVRRRMKLLELPRDLVQQAESRGVTLTDYEKLNAVKDPQRRNDVLRKIGTPEFASALKDARDTENKERNRDRLVAGLVKAGAKKIALETKAELDRRGELEVQERIYTWRWRDAEQIPELKPGPEYRVCAADDCIYLLRLKEKTKADADAQEKAAQKERARLRAAEELETLRQEMEQMAAGFRAEREHFVGEFDTWERSREEIMAFAVRMMLAYGGSYTTDKRAKLADWLGIDMDDGKLEEAGLRRLLRICPEKVLLYTAYWTVEGEFRTYTERRADYTVNAAVVYAKTDERTDVLYEGLKELGYTMSADEKAWQRGACPQYGLAKQILKEYKELK